MVIASSLSVKDLLTMRKTSTQKRTIAERTLINYLNAGKITPTDMRISTVKGLIDFFGKNCSKITKLNLQNFLQITDSDIENLSKNFININHLLLKNSIITNKFVVHFEKILLTSFDLYFCENLKDLSFLQHCKELTSLNLKSCLQIDDVSSLKHCTKLNHLDLSYCPIKDFSSLQHCKELKHLNLSYCKIKDLSFLKHCQELLSIDISYCPLIDVNSVGPLRSRGVKILGLF